MRRTQEVDVRAQILEQELRGLENWSDPDPVGQSCWSELGDWEKLHEDLPSWVR